MTTIFYLVRHGTTDYNVSMRFQGAIDIPLNDKGMQQMGFLSDYFKDIPIEAAYSSPLSRAQQTMAGVLKYHGEITPVLVPEITEIDGGEMEGLVITECNEKWPGIIETFKTAPGQFKAPGGESTEAVYDRVTTAINKIVRENAGKTIAVVSHGFAIQTWLNYAKGIPVKDMVEEIVDNVAVSRFSFDDDFNLTIDYIGDNSHLPEAMRQNIDWNVAKKQKASKPQGQKGRNGRKCKSDVRKAR